MTWQIKQVTWTLTIICLITTPAAWAAHDSPQPHAGTPSAVTPMPGTVIPSPDQVPGKQVSMAPDQDYEGSGDPERVVEWDGTGGVQNGLQYGGGTRTMWVDPDDGTSIVDMDLQVDALANRNDALVSSLLADQAGLLFSVDDADEIFYVEPTGFAGAPGGHGTWATAQDIDAVHPPTDVDGLEVWDETPPFDKANLYSLDGDPHVDIPANQPPEKVSIWEYDVNTGNSAPLTVDGDYVLSKHLLGAIDLYFGGPGIGGPDVFANMWEAFDVDALIVGDDGETILFSIEPFPLGTILQDPDIPDFHGGEIFVFEDASTPIGFLEMGGYTWDYEFDLVETFGDDLGIISYNINALETAAVPEPGTLALLGLGGLLSLRRQRIRS